MISILVAASFPLHVVAPKERKKKQLEEAVFHVTRLIDRQIRIKVAMLAIILLSCGLVGAFGGWVQNSAPKQYHSITDEGITLLREYDEQMYWLESNKVNRLGADLGYSRPYLLMLIINSEAHNGAVPMELAANQVRRMRRYVMAAEVRAGMENGSDPSWNELDLLYSYMEAQISSR